VSKELPETLKRPILSTFVGDECRLSLAQISVAHADHILRVVYLTGYEKIFNDQKPYTGVMFLHVPLEIYHSTVDNIFINKEIEPKFLQMLKCELYGTEGYILRLEVRSSGSEGAFTKHMVTKYNKEALKGNLCYYLKLKRIGEIQFLNSKFYILDDKFFRNFIVPLATYSSVIPAITTDDAPAATMRKRPLKKVEEEDNADNKKKTQG
jgi:hypothetical protein